MSPPANIGLLAGTADGVRFEPQAMPDAPGPDGLTVRMLFAPVNPADLLAIDGGYAFALAADDPLGAEGVGVVEQAGSRVSDLGPGDLVLPLDRGNWTRYRAVARDRVLAVPPGVDPRQAAMMRINPATAWLLLAASGAGPGDCLVQNAAGSTVAHWVRRLAALRDVAVIDVVRPGASAPGLADDEHLEAAVKAASGGRRVRAALDCVAGDATGRMAACLDAEGTVLVFGHLSGEPSTIRSQLLTGRGLTVRGFSLRPAEARMTPAARDAMVAGLWAAAGQGAVELPIRAVLPLAEAERAIALARTPGRGRVLIDLDAISGM
ncbi:Alcohol dehydrogenase GroES domain protein [Rhizorhabdus wittichii RW1]|uniref:enoyl-[acyl-carrier-protein] reductase n=1 Tax=Rhizorhabdus wittichii (strain DSM 6014 / CCUG 31198 / JCM 15750 / NBRC 105917 / EY 4224 / RW1) TaxID=392499 RepID=A0A9J9H868_RHIWR|nr:Alcohol dehydrogenase GroES domain protein [Rhizorhabdus wittichii RW1]